MAATNVKKVRDLGGLSFQVREVLSAIIWGYGSGAPDATNGAGSAGVGALFVDVTNATLYKNAGTKATPSWNAVGTVAAGEITLAEGSILQGNASGVAAALAAGGSGKILVGDGTDLASVAVSGDVTLAANGAVTIANDAVEAAMVAADQLTAEHADQLADDATTFGLPVLLSIAGTGGADGSVDITLDEKVEVIDAWYVLKGDGTAGSAITLDDGTNAIVAAVDISAGSNDTQVYRAVNIDDSKSVIAASGTIGATWVSTGGDCPAFDCYVLCVKRA